MRPERSRALVPDRALIDIGLLRQQSFADREHLARALRTAAIRSTFASVEAVEHLLVHRVEHQYVGRRQVCRLGLVEHRFREEAEGDPVLQVGALFKQRLVGA